MFELHPQLKRDCISFGDFELCHLLLMNESRYPWFILVPRRVDVSEIYQLSEPDQTLLMSESSVLSQILAEAFQADKMNIAAIGNIVQQLHVHHIVRHQKDAAWPQPVWGKFDALPYKRLEVLKIKQKLNDFLPEQFSWSD